ncbi:hypothetical protein ACIA5H_37240, partial [Nocardia sp. NPDC051900]|uniref:hypothetical protein n=1 Tax=Nocardia sp. NPDC051900 TaxID=3364326 RepID=UPI0037B9F754
MEALAPKFDVVPVVLFVRILCSIRLFHRSTYARPEKTSESSVARLLDRERTGHKSFPARSGTPDAGVRR